MKANIFDISRVSYVDGPGIRTTVFFKGCNLRCAWCHNPESQSPKKQILFYENKCKKCQKCLEKCPNFFEKCNFCGKCALFCPNDARELCGREYTVEEIFLQVVKDKSLYENSGGGVTFSGGECMLAIDFLEEILKRCKAEGLHTAVDTAGHIPPEYFERILPYTDLFLYDIKIADTKKHERYVGVGNELIISNIKRLISLGARVIVRTPIIAGINDTIEEVSAIAKIAKGAEKIELLPYHSMGEHKYSALGRAVERFSAPSEETMAILRTFVK